MSNLPIWTGDKNTDQLAHILQFEANSAFDDFFTSMATLLLSQDNKKKHSAAVGHSLKSYGVRTKPLAEWANAMVPMHLNRYPDYARAFEALQRKVGTKKEAVSIITEIYRDALNSKGHQAVLTSEFSCRMDSPSAMVRVDWPAWFQASTIEDIISCLRSIVEFSEPQFVAGKSVELKRKTIHQLSSICEPIPVTQLEFSIDHGNSLNANYCNIKGLRIAAKWALTTLIREGYLLYPVAWYSINHSQILYERKWWGSLAKYLPFDHSWSRKLFFRLICSSSIKSPRDFSISLCRQYSPSTTRLSGSMVKGFSIAIQRYQTEHPSSDVFPLGEINNRRKIHLKEEADLLRTPDNLRQEGLPDWAFAMEVFSKHAKLTRSGIREATKYLFDWAKEQGFANPWIIETRHLINPLNSEDETTFHAYVQRQTATGKRTGWNGAGRFYKVVINALRPLPEFDMVIQSNPFFGISNPFRNVKRKTPLGKTFRRLIPPYLLASMLETLLDCDEHGVPQYTWVKERFPVDTAERYNCATKQYEMVWHPARARCMAILLLIPLRSKQARWLDQGLMDTERWNIAISQWCENDHPLREYHYANGKTHAQMYGRPSGVLQPLDSLLGGNSDHIGLFVSTNKTQIWNPEQRTGYAIPWPDGKELLQSSDERLQKQGRQLGLVYQLIKEQIIWMEAYDPNPLPVNFSDDDEDFGEDTIKALPVFCPIFRDLISPATRNYTESVYVPISKQKLFALFHALAAETEDRLIARGYDKDSLGLTTQVRNRDSMIQLGRAESLRRCVYDIHSLRVAGITNLLEMGVPAHIVSEFIAGHMALVMTLHYAKFQPLKLRQKILDCFSEPGAIQRFEQVLEKQGPTVTGLLVKNQRFDLDMQADQAFSFEFKGAWRYVNGGVCPGALCSEGGIKVIEEGKWTKRTIVEVPGGPESCGNCRFFMTSPAFLVPQMLAANSIMLQLRELGRHRKRLWDDRAELEMKVFEGKVTGCDKQELTTIQAELERIDRKIEPLVLEWYNRYEMFRESQELMPVWDRLSGKGGHRSPLALYGSDDAVSMSAALDPHGSEYSLVKEIISQSELLGGRRAISELAEHKLREFVDRLLVHENVKDLLLTIPDAKQRRKAALMLSDALDVLAGGVSVVGMALEAGDALHLAPESQGILRNLAAKLAEDNWAEIDKYKASQWLPEEGYTSGSKGGK
ncbi:VPA1269 family protein [Microvirgula curvata]